MFFMCVMCVKMSLRILVRATKSAAKISKYFVVTTFHSDIYAYCEYRIAYSAICRFWVRQLVATLCPFGCKYPPFGNYFPFRFIILNFCSNFASITCVLRGTLWVMPKNNKINNYNSTHNENTTHFDDVATGGYCYGRLW